MHLQALQDEDNADEPEVCVPARELTPACNCDGYNRAQKSNKHLQLDVCVSCLANTMFEMNSSAS